MLMFCIHFQGAESANREITMEIYVVEIISHNSVQTPLSENTLKTLSSSINSEEMKIPNVEASSDVNVKVTARMCGSTNLSFDITECIRNRNEI